MQKVENFIPDGRHIRTSNRASRGDNYYKICIRIRLVLRNQAFALHELAFVLSRVRSGICEKISQFGTTKVVTEQYCNMHQNDNCCSMTRAVARQAVLCVLN